MLCERTACERFVTLFWGVFDVETSTLRYVNAGHVAPILIRRDENRMEQLVEGGPVLGLLPNVSYSAVTVQIAESDSLVLYSDGSVKPQTTTRKSSEKIAFKKSSPAAEKPQQAKSVSRSWTA